MSEEPEEERMDFADGTNLAGSSEFDPLPIEHANFQISFMESMEICTSESDYSRKPICLYCGYPVRCKVTVRRGKTKMGEQSLNYYWLCAKCQSTQGKIDEQMFAEEIEAYKSTSKRKEFGRSADQNKAIGMERQKQNDLETYRKLAKRGNGGNRPPVNFINLGFKGRAPNHPRKQTFVAEVEEGERSSDSSRESSPPPTFNTNDGHTYYIDRNDEGVCQYVWTCQCCTIKNEPKDEEEEEQREATEESRSPSPQEESRSPSPVERDSPSPTPSLPKSEKVPTKPCPVCVIGVCAVVTAKRVKKWRCRRAACRKYNGLVDQKELDAFYGTVKGSDSGDQRKKAKNDGRTLYLNSTNDDFSRESNSSKDSSGSIPTLSSRGRPGKFKKICPTCTGCCAVEKTETGDKWRCQNLACKRLFDKVEYTPKAEAAITVEEVPSKPSLRHRRSGVAASTRSSAKTPKSGRSQSTARKSTPKLSHSAKKGSQSSTLSHKPVEDDDEASETRTCPFCLKTDSCRLETTADDRRWRCTHAKCRRYYRDGGSHEKYLLPSTITMAEDDLIDVRACPICLAGTCTIDKQTRSAQLWRCSNANCHRDGNDRTDVIVAAPPQFGATAMVNEAQAQSLPKARKSIRKPARKSPSPEEATKAIEATATQKPQTTVTGQCPSCKDSIVGVEFNRGKPIWRCKARLCRKYFGKVDKDGSLPKALQPRKQRKAMKRYRLTKYEAKKSITNYDQQRTNMLASKLSGMARMVKPAREGRVTYCMECRTESCRIAKDSSGYRWRCTNKECPKSADKVKDNRDSASSSLKVIRPRGRPKKPRYQPSILRGGRGRPRKVPKMCSQCGTGECTIEVTASGRRWKCRNTDCRAYNEKVAHTTTLFGMKSPRNMILNPMKWTLSVSEVYEAKSPPSPTSDGQAELEPIESPNPCPGCGLAMYGMVRVPGDVPLWTCGRRECPNYADDLDAKFLNTRPQLKPYRRTPKAVQMDPTQTPCPFCEIGICVLEKDDEGYWWRCTRSSCGKQSDKFARMEVVKKQTAKLSLVRAPVRTTAARHSTHNIMSQNLTMMLRRYGSWPNSLFPLIEQAETLGIDVAKDFPLQKVAHGRQLAGADGVQEGRTSTTSSLRPLRQAKIGFACTMCLMICRVVPRSSGRLNYWWCKGCGTTRGRVTGKDLADIKYALRKYTENNSIEDLGFEPEDEGENGFKIDEEPGVSGMQQELENTDLPTYSGQPSSMFDTGPTAPVPMELEGEMGIKTEPIDEL